jgi:2-deoxy-D-gluconate 3-dehydrogenase
MTVERDVEPKGGPADSLFDLSGVGAVVTGAATDLGRAAAIALARHGAEVVPFDGPVTSETDRLTLVEAAADQAPITVLVNCAPVASAHDERTMSLDELDELWDMNIRATVGVTQAFLPGMIEQGRGKVINVGLPGSVAGLEQSSAHAATRGGLALYTKSLAHEVGRFGICVNAIAPGIVETETATDGIRDDARPSSDLLARIPLGRFGTAKDVEGLLVLLASPASDYVTGQIIMLDGGWTTS